VAQCSAWIEIPWWSDGSSSGKKADRKTRPKGNPEKVTLAPRLRAETTLKVCWIADPLAMGTRGHLNQLQYQNHKIGGE